MRAVNCRIHLARGKVVLDSVDVECGKIAKRVARSTCSIIFRGKILTRSSSINRNTSLLRFVNEYARVSTLGISKYQRKYFIFDGINNTHYSI